MATHLVRLHSCPQSDLDCFTHTTTKAATSSVVACDDGDATTVLVDQIDDADCLSQFLGTSASSTTTSNTFYSVDLQAAEMATPTTPISPTLPACPIAGVAGIEATTPDNNDNNNSNRGEHASPNAREHQKSRSRASSRSQRATRSASSSTAGNSKRPGTHRRATTSSSTQQQHSSPGLQSRGSSIHMSPQRRDQLLALHRDSCRLFQSASNTNPTDPLALAHTETHSTLSTAFVSPAASPILQSQRSHSFPLGFSMDSDISDEELPSSSASSHRRYRGMAAVAATSHMLYDTIGTVPETSELDQQQPSSSSPALLAPVATAVTTEWTSPSTRRREYEKIDRSNRGIRRIWRRLTPSCFHSEHNSRTPFFEEGNKKNYEGSVRRFRMDIPDDDEDGDRVHVQNEKSKNADGLLVTTAAVKGEKGWWSCF